LYDAGTFAAISGAIIHLTGSQSTTTDAFGGFSFSSLTSGGNYTVTPQKLGYAFNPASTVHTNMTTNKNDLFEATLTNYSMSGHVTTGLGAAISGVTITWSGSESGATTSDAGGAYSFNVSAGGDYAITPTKTNYSFSPATRIYNNVSAAQPAADFTGAFATYTISGHIADGSSTALIGVTVTLSGGQTGTTTTDASGNYSFASLPATGNYTVTPSQTDYTFNPTSQTFNNLSASQSAGFAGALTPNVTLTASVTPNGTVQPRTDLVYTISFSNNGAGSASAFVVTDPIPTNTDFKLSSMTTSLGTTGLAATLAYSNDGGVTWIYAPSSAAGGAPAGYDRNVTHVRWSFAGSLSPTAPNNAGSVSLTTRIR
jgi:uncharacterized repeat protein (TIGR01451 family)